MKNDMATESVWSRASANATGTIKDGERVGALVIGAGIAGLSVAYELTRRGVRPLVVDDGPVGGGQTGRTSAHLASALDDRYYELASIRGEGAARLAAESHSAAIDEIERIVAAEQIDCGFRRVTGYLVLAQGDGPDVLDKEFAAGTRAGLRLTRLAAPWWSPRAHRSTTCSPCTRSSRPTSRRGSPCPSGGGAAAGGRGRSQDGAGGRSR